MVCFFIENHYRCAPAIAAIAAIIVNVAQRNKRQRNELQVNNLSENSMRMKEKGAYARRVDSHRQETVAQGAGECKQEAKRQAKAKLGEFATDSKPRVRCWILGSMDARTKDSLREG